MDVLINKKSLRLLLEQRFYDDEIKSLSQLPLPSVFTDMQKAIDRTKKAIENGECITIIGDYDVDGVTSSALMKIFFDSVGHNVKVVIPNRFTDGYGLSANIAEKIDTSLVITVDNGIGAIESAKILKSKNVDLIIIDHHTIGMTLPFATAIIHPNLTSPRLKTVEICAALVTWYFLAGLKNELKIHFDIKKLLQLVAIATIADVMPLVCINRTVVRAGLEQLNISDMPFAIALRDMSKTKFRSEDIAFRIAPRLNSAGRMSDATIAYEFLSATSIEQANKKLEELNQLNEQRKKIELDTYEEAKKQVVDDSPIAIVSGDEWHEGVLGIVASRIAQQFKKPTIALSTHDNIAKGSARSIGKISIYDLIRGASEYLLTFGGHMAAAGLSLNEENIGAFKDKILLVAKSMELDNTYDDEHLGEFEPNEIDLELCEILEEFEPFGQKNEKPKFFGSSFVVSSSQIVGKDKNVLKLSVKTEKSKTLECVCFNSCHTSTEAFAIGDKVSFSYFVTKNSYKGHSSAQLLISDIFG